MNIEKQILIVEVQYLYWNKSLCYKQPKEQKEKIRIASTKYIVYQYTLEGELVDTYYGMNKAAEAVNTDYKSIQRACNGRAKTCKGFIWKKILMQPDCKQVA